jgi:hypothetical protein
MATLLIYKYESNGNMADPKLFESKQLIKHVEIQQPITSENCGDILIEQSELFLASINDSNNGMDGDFGSLDVWSKNEAAIYHFTFDSKTLFDIEDE